MTAFAIAIVRGYQPRALELAGAGLTIAALVASSVLVRRRLAATQASPAARPSAAPAAGRLRRRAA